MASKPVIRALKILLQGYTLSISWRESEIVRAFTMHPVLCEAGPDIPYAVVQSLINDGFVEGETFLVEGRELGTYYLSERGAQVLRFHTIGVKNNAESLLQTLDRSTEGIV